VSGPGSSTHGLSPCTPPSSSRPARCDLRASRRDVRVRRYGLRTAPCGRWAPRDDGPTRRYDLRRSRRGFRRDRRGVCTRRSGTRTRRCALRRGRRRREEGRRLGLARSPSPVDDRTERVSACALATAWAVVRRGEASDGHSVPPDDPSVASVRDRGVCWRRSVVSLRHRCGLMEDVGSVLGLGAGDDARSGAAVAHAGIQMKAAQRGAVGNRTAMGVLTS
jgi:hypothetical protein